MALTKNQDLLEKIIPPDNALKENMSLGVYHFRFWKLNAWHDVVIDDFLPTNSANQLLFSHNSKHPNEFWAPLFEKAFAKYFASKHGFDFPLFKCYFLYLRFMGNYDELEGGLFENSALYLSGGLYQEYKTQEVLATSAKKEASAKSNLKPNVDDLFEIIKIALQKKDMVGCILENVI